MAEMIGDLTTRLRQKEPGSGLPLVELFQAILSGQRTAQQRARFGDRATRAGRQVIVQTIQNYAQATGNYRLLHLLKQFEGFQSNKPMPSTARSTAVPTAQPRRSDTERDFRSIASVLERLGRPVGTADLGRYRRRWLEYPPRDAASGHKNRLEEVLAKMIADGVLRTQRTMHGATFYAPGPNFEQYRVDDPVPS